MEWKPYTKNRLIAQHPSGFYIIKPDDHDSRAALSCELCDRLYRTKDDDDANREFGCCHLCALKWAHPRREQWNTGWRPTRDQIDLDVSQRPPLSFSIDLE